MLKLLLPVFEFQGEVDNKDTDVIEFHFDDQPFYSFVKVMKARAVDCPVGEQGITLFIQYGNPAGQGSLTILGFHHMKVVQAFGNSFGLTTSSATIGAGINFNKTDDIRLNGTHEGNDLLQGVPGLFEKPGKGQRQVVTFAMACGVPYVIE